MGFFNKLKKAAKTAVSSPTGFLETITYGGPGATSLANRSKPTGSAAANAAGVEAGGNYTPEAVKPGLTSGGHGPTGQNSGPGFGEMWGADNLHRTDGPSRSATFAQGAGKQLGYAGASEGVFGKYGQQMTGPSMGQMQYGRSRQAVGGPSNIAGFRGDNAAALGSAGQGEQYWNQQAGKFNMPTNTQGAFDKLQAGPAGLDAYYDRARDRQAGGINDQLAARGQYGSSAGLDQLSEGAAALNAEQANREADFRLQQQDQIMRGAASADVQNQGLLGLGMDSATSAQNLGLDRMKFGSDLAGMEDTYGLDRERLFGEMSGLADQGNIGRFEALMGGAEGSDRAKIDRITSAGDLYNQGDRADMDRLGLGADIASGVQDLGRNRTNDMYDHMFGLSDAVSGMYGDSANNALEADAANADAAMALEMGIPAEQVLQDRYDAAAARARQQSFMEGGDAIWGRVNESARDMGESAPWAAMGGG